MSRAGLRQPSRVTVEEYTWPVRRVMFTVGAVAVVITPLALWLPLWAIIPAIPVTVAVLMIPRCRLSAWGVCCAAAALILSVVVIHRVGYVAPLEELAGQTDTITGQIVDVPASGAMYTVRIVAAEKIPEGRRLLLYIPDKLAPARGNMVTVSVELCALREGQTYRRAQGLHLCAFPAGYDEESVRIEATEDGWLNSMRCRLTEMVRRALPGDEGAVLAAMCLGDRSGLDEAWTTTFSRSGISHLLVVSGLHLSTVAGAVLLLCGWCGRRAAGALAMPAVLAFMWLIGDTPSVVRAGVMVLVFLAGRLIRQRSDGLNSLGLAATLLLLYNPYFIYSAGFQLSFAATTGVLVIAPRLYRGGEIQPGQTGWMVCLYKIKSGLQNGAAVCIGATLFTLPFLCYYFGGFPLATLPANLLAVPAGGEALLLGWAGMLLSLFPLTMPIGQGFLMLAGVLIRYLHWVATVCSADGLFLPVETWWLLLLVGGVCLLIIAGILTRISARRIFGVVGVITILTLGVGCPLTDSLLRVTVTPTASGAVLTICQGGQTALCVTDGDSLKDAVWAIGEEEPACVLVGSGTLQQAGALTELPKTTAVYCAAHKPWIEGVPFEVTTLTGGDTMPLWSGHVVTIVAYGWWRLECGGAPIWICTDSTVPPPDPVGLVLYTGTPPQVSPGATCVAVGESLLPETLSGYALVINENAKTLVLRKTGEWSVLPWL